MEDKGKINNYNCDNNHTTITKNIDEGVTPFIIGCPKCGKEATSKMYRVEQIAIPNAFWVKLSDGEVFRMSEINAESLRKRNPDYVESVEDNTDTDIVEFLYLQSKDHSTNGGLFLISIGDEFSEEYVSDKPLLKNTIIISDHPMAVAGDGLSYNNDYTPKGTVVRDNVVLSIENGEAQLTVMQPNPIYRKNQLIVIHEFTQGNIIDFNCITMDQFEKLYGIDSPYPRFTEVTIAGEK